MVIFEIAKNEIWPKKIREMCLFDFMRFFLAWTFLNFLAHCVTLTWRQMPNLYFLFQVAIQSAPSRYEFIQAFKITTDFEQNFKLMVVPKLAEYLESLDCCLTALKSILEKVEKK